MDTNSPYPFKIISPIDYFSVDDVAGQLKVSRNQVLAWVESGQLTGERTRRYWRFTERDLRKFLDAQGLSFDEEAWLAARSSRLLRQRRKVRGPGDQ